MAVVVTPELVSWWETPTGRTAISTAAALSWSPKDLLRSTSVLRKACPSLTPEQLGATTDLIQARQRAATKLGPDSAEWFLTLEAVQQATPVAVADYRAARLAASLGAATLFHDATCSIGTELVSLKRHGFWALSGSDLDAARLAMARHNVPAARFHQADCRAPSWGTGTITLLDPARRTSTGQRRYRGPKSTTPTLTEVLDTYRDTPYLVKCAPGIDWKELFAEGWGTGAWDGEVEIISLTGSADRGVKEAALWSSQLVEMLEEEHERVVTGPRSAVSHEGAPLTQYRRRATVLDPTTGQIVDQIANTPALEAAAADVAEGPVGEILIEPDGAIVRAGLVRHWAARHGFWQLDSRIAHLTGEKAPAGVAYYPVEQQLRFRPGDLKKALRQEPTSAVEILVRGVDVDPVQLRRSIFPKPVAGAPARTVVVSRVGTSAVAFLCGARQVG